MQREIISFCVEKSEKAGRGIGGKEGPLAGRVRLSSASRSQAEFRISLLMSLVVDQRGRHCDLK